MNDASDMTCMNTHALINEITDLHGRTYRTFVTIQRDGHDLFDIHLSSTYSGSERPDQHRTLWRASLTEKSLQVFEASIDWALATNNSEFQPEPILRPNCVIE